MSIEEASKELAAFLNGTKVSELEAPKAVIEVTVDMTPTQAATLLWKEKVIGAPVWDGKKYLGFFDMRDLLSTVIASHKEEEEKKRGNINITDFFFTKWFLKDIIGNNKNGSTSNNFSVSYLAARNPFVSLTNDATLMDVCKMCAKRHCHRVPIIDPNTGRCVRIVSQSALVKFLVEQLVGVGVGTAKGSESIQTYFARTLQEANFPYKKQVLSAPDTATAQEVFELMDEHRLSGIAVVDRNDGALVGNTSASDIKLAVAVDHDSPLPFADLNLNIVTYLSAVRQEEPSKTAKYPSSHVRESSSTLAHAIKLLAKTGYHRVFVVDEELKPVGVVSVTDVVDYLAGQ